MKKLLCFALALLLFYGFSNAQKEYTEIQMIPLPGPIISDVDFDTNGDVWMSFARRYPLVTAQSYGIAKWDGQTVTSYNHLNAAFTTNTIFTIAVTSTYIWLGTDNGLQRLVKNKDLNIGAQYDPSLTQKGLGRKIISLKKDGEFLWVGSDNGLGKLNITNDSFKYYSSALWGKPNAVIYTIERGENGDVWLGTDRGVVKITANNNFTVYDKSNSGLLCDSVYALYWKDSKKELWIGSEHLVKNNQNYFGLFVLNAGAVLPVEDEINCGYRELAAFPSRIFSIAESSNGDILAAIGIDLTANVVLKPAFISVRGNKSVSKYFIRESTTNNLASTSLLFPTFIKNMPNNKLWLGIYNQRAYIMDDISKIANEDENLGVLQNTTPRKLDINQVSAMVQNNGDMFWDLISQSKYEVPKNSCKSPLFASALWMGGIDFGGNIHTAAMTYRQYGIDFFPGPLDTIAATSPINGDSTYKKIWKISRWEIEDFKTHYADGSLTNGTYLPPADFISWPAHGTGKYTQNLAPFVDIDNNAKYEPLKGDYPKIKGEEALYWIFNDAGNLHSETGGLKLGVEVHAMAYAYNCDTIQAGSPNEALNYTTFYEYEIINRSTYRYDSTFLGVWTDVDLGNNHDDYIGCSPKDNFGFVYNADNNDEGPTGYGANPPMLSVVFLSDSMTNFMSYNNDFSIFGNPTISRDYFNLLQSKFKDNTRATIPVGPNAGQPTNYTYSGTPYIPGEWNEQEVGNVAGDRRFLQSAGPYTLEPGGVKKLSYAIVYSHEPNKPNGLTTSWAKNMNDVNAVKNWYKNQTFPTCPTKPTGLAVAEKNLKENTVKLYPNPTNGNTTIEFTLLDNSSVSFEVFNVLGQKVYEIESQLNEGAQVLTAELGNQPAGLYIYVLKSGNSRVSGKVIKTE